MFSNFRDIPQMQESSPTYSFDMCTKGIMLVKNDSNVPHVQSNLPVHLSTS